MIKRRRLKQKNQVAGEKYKQLKRIAINWHRNSTDIVERFS